MRRLKLEARGSRDVDWRLQERRCLGGARGCRSFLICPKQANNFKQAFRRHTTYTLMLFTAYKHLTCNTKVKADI